MSGGGVRRGASFLIATGLMVTGCHSSPSPAAVATTTTAAPATTVTAASGPGASPPVPIQTSGPRTVLSPIGLNVRTQPAKTAPVAGTAAQGATLTVIGHTDQGGGWYQVKGATVTGYITDNPALSANGKFTPYDSSSHNFSALYPEGWTVTEAPPASVVFHPPTGPNSIVVTNAATTALLGRGRSGFRQQASSVVVVCGVTGDLITLLQSTPAPATSSPPLAGAPLERYLIQIHLALDATHALGVDANLADLAQQQVVSDFVHSISFPFPQCEQGATPNQTSSTAPASTVP